MRTRRTGTHAPSQAQRLREPGPRAPARRADPARAAPQRRGARRRLGGFPHGARRAGRRRGGHAGATGLERRRGQPHRARSTATTWTSSWTTCVSSCATTRASASSARAPARPPGGAPARRPRPRRDRGCRRADGAPRPAGARCAPAWPAPRPWPARAWRAPRAPRPRPRGWRPARTRTWASSRCWPASTRLVSSLLLLGLASHYQERDKGDHDYHDQNDQCGTHRYPSSGRLRPDYPSCSSPNGSTPSITRSR